MAMVTVDVLKGAQWSPRIPSQRIATPRRRSYSSCTQSVPASCDVSTLIHRLASRQTAALSIRLQRISPTSSLFMVAPRLVCVESARTPHRLTPYSAYDLKMIMKKDVHDIVRPQWLLDCVAAGQRLPLKKKYECRLLNHRKHN